MSVKSESFDGGLRLEAIAAGSGKVPSIHPGGPGYLCNLDGERLCGRVDDDRRLCMALLDHDGDHEWTGRVA